MNVLDAIINYMRRPRFWLYALIIGGGSLFVLANAHLVYLAFRSDPGCVDHLKTQSGVEGEFAAAKSAC